ncbi:MAG: hypothetical protein A2Z16_05425 [Chloroflexi bacterium RBG_16_54_18]|nr:MAG: hypothetical protein A2Z16_05425 [Chloroflexi bacterium RBG_16_54_18]
MPITIKDIAKKAGVSVATVSYVINESRRVSPDVTAKVLEAIDNLGYSPNAIARSLRRKYTKTIGLIVPDNSNPFYAEIAKGVEDAGFEVGYSVLLCNSNDMTTRELVYVDMLRSKRVDGVVFSSTKTTIEDQIRPLIKLGIPAVVFYRNARDLDVDTLRIDNIKVGLQATNYLIELGHTRIACIKPLSSVSPSALRVEGYRAALEAHRLPWNEELVVQGDNRITGGEGAAKQLLGSGADFSAIFACNDVMAIGAMSALRDACLNVPQDVSVIGVDDIILASYSAPPLTTISQPKYEAGRQAVTYLIERIEGKYDRGPRDVILKTELVVRDSCMAYRA